MCAFYTNIEIQFSVLNYKHLNAKSKNKPFETRDLKKKMQKGL